MSGIEDHRATVMQEALERQAARQAAEGVEPAPVTRRPEPMLRRRPAVSGELLAALAAGGLFALALLASALGRAPASISRAPAAVMQPTAGQAQPGAALPQAGAALPQAGTNSPQERVSGPQSGAALAQPTAGPTALPGSYIEPVNPVPAAAPQPVVNAAPPQALPVDPAREPAELVPIPTEAPARSQVELLGCRLTAEGAKCGGQP
jgi:hypothetical protein